MGEEGEDNTTPNSQTLSNPITEKKTHDKIIYLILYGILPLISPLLFTIIILGIFNLSDNFSFLIGPSAHFSDTIFRNFNISIQLGLLLIYFLISIKVFKLANRTRVLLFSILFVPSLILNFAYSFVVCGISMLIPCEPNEYLTPLGFINVNSFHIITLVAFIAAYLYYRFNPNYVLEKSIFTKKVKLLSLAIISVITLIFIMPFSYNLLERSRVSTDLPLIGSNNKEHDPQQNIFLGLVEGYMGLDSGVIVYNFDEMKLIKHIALGKGTETHLVSSEDGSYVFAINSTPAGNNSKLTIIDPKTLSIIQSLNVMDGAEAPIVIDNHIVIYATNHDPQVMLINSTTFTVEGTIKLTIPALWRIDDVIVSNDGKYIYYAYSDWDKTTNPSTLTMVDVMSETTLKTITLGGQVIEINSITDEGEERLVINTRIPSETSFRGFSTEEMLQLTLDSNDLSEIENEVVTYRDNYVLPYDIETYSLNSWTLEKSDEYVSIFDLSNKLVDKISLPESSMVYSVLEVN